MSFLPTKRLPLTARLLLGLNLSLALTLSATLPARAAGLQVSPVRVQFESTQQAQALQLQNAGAGPLEAQVRIMRWSQPDGVDKLEPSDDFAISPAIVRIGKGQSQTVRLIRVKPVSSEREQSYRVLVDELPDSAQAAGQSGVKVLLRYSIPVFVSPPAASTAAATAQTSARVASLTDLSQVRAQLSAREGKAILQIHNGGAKALRISALNVRSASLAQGEPQSLGQGLFGYVLPGQQMVWPLKLALPLPTDLSLKARFNDDREAQPLPLDGATR